MRLPAPDEAHRALWAQLLGDEEDAPAPPVQAAAPAPAGDSAHTPESDFLSGLLDADGRIAPASAAPASPAAASPSPAPAPSAAPSPSPVFSVGAEVAAADLDPSLRDRVRWTARPIALYAAWLAVVAAAMAAALSAARAIDPVTFSGIPSIGDLVGSLLQALSRVLR